MSVVRPASDISTADESASEIGSDRSNPRRFGDLIEQSRVALLVVDTQADDRGELLYANRAALSLLDVEALPSGVTLHDVVPDNAGAVLAACRAKPQTGTRSRPVPVDLLPLAAAQHTADADRGSRLRSCDAHITSRADGTAIVQLVERAIALETARVLEEQHRFRAALMELSELAYTTQDDDEFYQRLIEHAVEVVPGAQAGSVQLVVPGTTAFRFVAAVGFDVARLQEHELDKADLFRDTSTPRAQVIREFTIQPRSPEITEWLNTAGRLSELVVTVSAPVLVDGQPVAILSLDNFEDPDAMTETSVEMTTVLSHLIGELWRRRDLEADLRTEREALRHQAMHDPLTGLANRRSLEKALAGSLSRGQRRQYPRSVLFVDIDDFKGVNDRLGHEVGDLLLVAVADGLRDVVRANDLVGRWGGDEFLVLPYRVNSSKEATDLAQRILTYFEDDVRLADGFAFRARLTIGVGWSDDSRVDSSLLVRSADQALYQAKAAGKGVARLRRATSH